MPAPKLHYVPLDEEETRFKVYADADHRQYLGTVYDTAGAGWVADWDTRGRIAMPGFQSYKDAAATLYWFAPPQQSFGSRPAGDQMGVVDGLKIDTSLCGCCADNQCECEGSNRISARYGTTQSYAVQPSLIPRPGVLISLLPMPAGDFLVDCNTWGSGAGIGYLQHRDDGRYDVRAGSKVIGIAATPETGMWAAFKEYTGSKRYEQILKDYEPHEKPVYTLPAHR